MTPQHCHGEHGPVERRGKAVTLSVQTHLERDDVGDLLDQEAILELAGAIGHEVASHDDQAVFAEDKAELKTLSVESLDSALNSVPIVGTDVNVVRPDDQADSIFCTNLLSARIIGPIVRVTGQGEGEAPTIPTFLQRPEQSRT